MSENTQNSQLKLWEVFTQAKTGKPYEHQGSVHAADAEMAIQNARDVFTRRGGAVSIWVAPSDCFHSTSPDEAGPFFDPGNDKIYRHPQFYKIPKGVNLDIH